MKKLGQTITVITFSLFVTSLLLLSAQAPFADSGHEFYSSQPTIILAQEGAKVRNQAEVPAQLKPPVRPPRSSRL